ncbi:MAG: hypothetical protein AB8B72_00925 [Crocinitomicaceae bacterium]
MIQSEYNEKHGITPYQIKKSIEQIMKQTKVADGDREVSDYSLPTQSSVAADPIVTYMSKSQLENAIAKVKKDMEAAARKLDFIEAASMRDDMYALQERLKEVAGK